MAERWPEVAAAIRHEPALIEALESTVMTGDLKSGLEGLVALTASPISASTEGLEDLIALIRSPPLLAPVVDRLLSLRSVRAKIGQRRSELPVETSASSREGRPLQSPSENASAVSISRTGKMVAARRT